MVKELLLRITHMKSSDAARQLQCIGTHKLFFLFESAITFSLIEWRIFLYYSMDLFWIASCKSLNTFIITFMRVIEISKLFKVNTLICI